MKNRKFILVLLVLLVTVHELFGYSSINNQKTANEIKASNQREIMVDKTKTVTTKTYVEKTDSPDVKNWNTRDFQKHLDKNSKNSIVNSRSLFDLNNEAIQSSNPDLMNSEYIDSKKTDTQWRNNIVNGLISSSTSSGNTGSLSGNQGTIKCYVSRDLPIRYKCPYTGLIISEDIKTSGLKAKTRCEDGCSEDLDCVSVKNNPVINIANVNNLSLKTSSDLSAFIEKEISSDDILDYLEFDLKVTDNNSTNKEEIKVKLSLSVYDYSQEIPLIAEEDIPLGTYSRKVIIRNPTDKIYIKISRASEKVHVEITNVKATYKLNSRFICGKIQDIAQSQAENFGYICPSGNLITFKTTQKDYKICADYGLSGDYRDGSFSTLNSCRKVCKKQYKCTLDVRITDTAILQDYREGCIAGQENCTLTSDTCKDLRLGGAKILNENVFNGRQEIKNTIINSNLVPGVTRPRLILQADKTFLERSKEEWKDEAYLNMTTGFNYKTTLKKINEDTEVSYGYSYGIELMTSDGIPIKSLYLDHKPSAFDVNGVPFYFYMIAEVITEKYIYDSNGYLVNSKDKILYLKTDKEHDYFKAFAKKKNYSQNVEVDNKIVESLNNLAQWEYSTYIAGVQRWVFHSKDQSAEYYKKEKILLTAPYLRHKVLKNIRNFQKSLKGIMSSTNIVNGRVTKHYDGLHKSSGETIRKYKMYPYYSSEKATYSQIMEDIKNGIITPFYDSLSPGIYAKEVKDDNNSRRSDIKTFLYGATDKKNAYIQIKTKPNELNKKGFLFIFAY